MLPPEHTRSTGPASPAWPAAQLSLTAVLPVICSAHGTVSGTSSSNIGTTLDYRRLDAEGQRVRCLAANERLSNRNSCGRFERPLHQNPQRLRQEFAFLLQDRRFLAEQVRRKLRPRRCGGGKCCCRAAKDESICAIQRGPSGILEIFLRRIHHCEIQAWFQELQQRVALQNKRWQFTVRGRLRFLDRGSQQRKPLGQKSLLGAQPKGAACSGGQKSRAICPRICVKFPIQCADVLGRRAVAIVSVLRADSVSILRDLSGNPVCVGKSGNYVANKLCLSNTARVSANDNYAPVRRRLFSIRPICFQLSPLDL